MGAPLARRNTMSMTDIPDKYELRLWRAAQALEGTGADVLLLCPGADLFYLSGFEHSHAGERLLALVLRSDGAASWIAPVMNVAQVRESALTAQPVRGWTDAEGYLPTLREAAAGLRSIAFDEEARA